MNLDYFHSKISDLQTKILSLQSNLRDPTDTLNEVIEELSSVLKELDVAKREIFQQNEDLQTEVNPVRISWTVGPATLTFVRDIARRKVAEDTTHLRGYDAIKEVFLRCNVFQSQGNVYPILYSLEERGAYENSCCG